MDIYGLAFDDQARFGTLVAYATNCTISYLTPLANALTPALGEVARLQITQTAANPQVTFGLSTLPGAEHQRVTALLGLRGVSGFAWWCGEGSSQQLMLTAYDRAKNIAVKSFNGIVLRPQGTQSNGAVSVIELGRYWSSNLAQAEHAPIGSWSDGGEDSGAVIETLNWGASFGAGRVRDVLPIPLGLMSQAEAYEGAADTMSVQGYASLYAARRNAGVSDHVLAGYFTELALGRWWSSSEQIGAGRLTYGRLTSVPSISRIQGDQFESNLEIAELM